LHELIVAATQAASKVLTADEKKQIEQTKKVKKNELMVSD